MGNNEYQWFWILKTDENNPPYFYLEIPQLLRIEICRDTESTGWICNKYTWNASISNWNYPESVSAADYFDARNSMELIIVQQMFA